LNEIAIDYIFKRDIGGSSVTKGGLVLGLTGYTNRVG